MHGLGAQELLAFARCSAQLMHAASNPFAWRHADMVTVRSGSLASIQARPSRLLGFMPVSLRCALVRSSKAAAAFDLADETIGRILSSALLIRGLNATS